MILPQGLADQLRGGSDELFVAHLTTASRGGVPNIYPSPFTDVTRGGLVLMPDLFAQKTKVNLNENRAASLSFTTEEGAAPWVLEGVADIVQWGHPHRLRLFGLVAGDVLAGWGDWDETVEPVVTAGDPHIRPTVFAQRGVIVFKPERVREVA